MSLMVFDYCTLCYFVCVPDVVIKTAVTVISSKICWGRVSNVS